MLKIREKDLLMAMTLGDGCIEKEKYSFSLTIGHGESQKDYAEWKMDLLNNSEIFDKNIKMLTKKVNLNGKNFIQYRFKKTSKKLGEIYDDYKDIKTILKDLKSDLSLAIWFMDDGSVFKRKQKHKDGSIYYLRPTMKLCTHCFSEEDNKYIIEWFKKRYKIEPKLVSETKRNRKGTPKYYYIRFNAKETEKIFNLIKEYINQVPSMRKKFNYLITYYANK